MVRQYSPPFVTDNDTFELVNPVAFALGAEIAFFNKPPRNLALNSFRTLAHNSGLNYLRALNIVRNIVLKQYHVSDTIPSTRDMSFDTLFHFPYFVTSTLKENDEGILSETGTTIFERIKKLNWKIENNLYHLNPYIPEWEPNRAWIFDLFRFPEDISYDGLRKLTTDFYTNCTQYPFRLWMNTTKPYTQMLHSDYYLMFYIYKDHDAQLDHWAKYKSSGKSITAQIKERQANDLYESDLAFVKDMLDSDGGKAFVVDGQNIKPELMYRFASWIEDNKPGSISEIFIIGDCRDKNRWEHSELYTKTPVTFITTDRLVGRKSVVDIGLAATMCQLYYERKYKTFFILSSDSDFIPMSDILPDAKCCFCGHSKSMTFRAVDFAKKSGARCICLDKFLDYVEQTNFSSANTIQEIATQLNEAQIDAECLIDIVKEICSKTGTDVDRSVARILLSQVLYNYHVKVTEDCHFEFVERKNLKNTRV